MRKTLAILHPNRGSYSNFCYCDMGGGCHFGRLIQAFRRLTLTCVQLANVPLSNGPPPSVHSHSLEEVRTQS